MTRIGPVGTFLVLVACLLTSACSPPVLDGVEPATGYPRQLLAVNSDALGASVVWDVGLPTEQTIANGVVTTSYFQIPAGATPGTHPVALRNSKGTSASQNVTVLAPSGNFPAPRIESIDVLRDTPPDEGAGSSRTLLLTVAAANMDVDATIALTNTGTLTCYQWGAIPLNFQQVHTPATFAYPVYHYEQKVCRFENAPESGPITVTVTNSDGQAHSRDYLVLPPSALDSDGDGIMDTIEQSNLGGLDLPKMGADPEHKTIFVEADWTSASVPNVNDWATLEAAFADAPVLNPDGTRGITLIIDRGQDAGQPGGLFTKGGELLPAHSTMDFGASSALGYKNFFDYKSAHFDSQRLPIFHYAVIGVALPNGSSGRGEIWGNDFMVTFATFAKWGSSAAESATFMHELGHNLGLRHGGLVDDTPQNNETRKPNFASTMNYRYQFPLVSIDCNFVSDNVLTYSQGILTPVTESSVTETAGICDNAPLDMNGDMMISVASLAIDTNSDGDRADTHQDLDQWGNLKMSLTGSGWKGN